MSIFTRLARAIFASHDAAGNARQIDPAQAAAWGTEIEAVIDNAFVSGSSILFSELTSLEANLDHPATTLAWVMGDPTPANNGIYQKLGDSGAGSWVRRGDLPYSFISLVDAGAGTPNAIVATSTLPMPSAAYGALFLMNVFEANTGAVTLSVNGATAKPVVTNSGSALEAGYLTAGMLAAMVDDGTNYRLITDVAAASVVAEAEAAQAAAEAARDEAVAAAAGVNLPAIASGDAFKQMVVKEDESGHLLVRTDINAMLFGVANDGSTDDFAAWEDLFGTAALLRDAGENVLIRLPWGKGSKITGDLALGRNISFIQDAPLIYAGPDLDNTILTVGELGGSTKLTLDKLFRLRVQREWAVGTSADWSSPDSKAIVLNNLSTCEVHLRRAEACTVGVEINSDNTGTVHNDFYLGRLFRNQKPLVFRGLAGGWVNSNRTYGGTLNVQSNDMVGTARQGIEVDGGPSFQANNNVFHAPAIEMWATGGDVTAFVFKNAANNDAHGVRCESYTYLSDNDELSFNNKVRLGLTAQSKLPIAQSNRFLGHGEVLHSPDGGYGNLVLGAASSIVPEGITTYPVHSVGNLGRASFLNGTDVGVRGLSVLVASPSYVPARAGPNVTQAASYVTLGINGAIGFKIDTQRAKIFLARKGIRNDGATGRWLVKCYDGTGTLLTDTAGKNTYCRGGGIAYNTAMSGCYLGGTDSLYPVLLEVSDEVKSIWVGVWRGSADVELESIAVETLDPIAPRWWPGYTETFYEQPLIVGVGTAAYNPPSLAAGAGAVTSVSVPGLRSGDICEVAFSLDSSFLQFTANWLSDDLARVAVQNVNSAAVDLGAGTLTVVGKRYKV